MRSIYLSAHLDDAILSCGGLIFDQSKKGIQAEIWTYFCGIPPGQLEAGYTARADENIRAAQTVGAKPINEYCLDAFGRGYKTVFEPVSANDEVTVSMVAGSIARELKPDDRLMVPLAIGKHVDHVVLRKAAERLDVPLIYYADFPYVDYVPGAIAEAAQGLIKHAVTITPAGLVHWTDAVREYISQNFYETPDKTREKIIEYWAKVNGIFLWERPTTEQIFTKIYYENMWGDSQTVSGPGSRLEETEVVRQELPRIVLKYGIKSMLDLPCGDFFWMRLVDMDIDYIGADIVMDEIRMNQKNYGSYQNKRFVYADILGDHIPNAGLLLCRDCLPHLSQKDALRAVGRIYHSACSYLLTTTFPEARSNWDIVTGAWRPINLQASPYNFPTPLELFDEKSPLTIYGPKCLGLWAIKDLKDEL